MWGGRDGTRGISPLFPFFPVDSRCGARNGEDLWQGNLTLRGLIASFWMRIASFFHLLGHSG